MPEPIITPDAQRSSSVCGAQPASSIASVPATIARWMKRSIFFWSLTGIHSFRSSPPSARLPAGICPATLQGSSLVSKDWMAPMPLSPRIRRRQTCSTPTPSGQAMPIPVTTTRRPLNAPNGVTKGSGGLLLLDVVDRVLHRADLLGRVLGDLDAEGFLEGHHQLDRIEAVGPEIVDERRFGRDLALLDAEVLDHDLLNLLGDLGVHSSSAPGTCPAGALGLSRKVRARFLFPSDDEARRGPDSMVW